MRLRSSAGFRAGLASGLVLLFTCTASAQGTRDPVASMTAEDIAHGKRLFDAQCARCHGIGGTGGEGPVLARPRLRRAADNRALFDVVKNGIPGTGMLETWQRTDEELWQIVAYVRSLGRVEEESVRGDAVRGESIFAERGGCVTCHTVRGNGGTLGPDLTGIAERRGATYLRQALLEPAAAAPRQPVSPVTYWGGYVAYLIVRAVTKDGEVVEGTRMNEDSFTIQIRDADGQYHSLRKTELTDLVKKFDTSLMPTYHETLSTADVEDLVAFLSTLRGTP